MKKIASLLAILMIFSVLLVGCKSDGEKEVISLIKKNLEYFNEEDIDGYINTISSESPVYEPTKIAIEQAFELYDLKVTLDKIEVLEIDDEIAKVQVTQTTKKEEGPEFKNNKTIAVHTLIKTEDGWKVSNSDIKNIEYID